ncbi:MAG: endonuclease [Coprobacillus sp.]|nr:endonuclease [Coprobacillus sp.]
MKNSKKSLIIASVFALLLCACNETTSDTKTSESESSSTSTSNNTDGSDTSDMIYQTYYWVPVKSQFSTDGGSVTHNGLTWSYGSSSYFTDDTNEAKRGLQIGSSNNPQTGGWTLSTDFGEEVILSDLTLVMCVGSSGSAKYSISLDSTSIASNVAYSNTSLDEFSYESLDLTGSKLSITLTANSKAMFLKSITLGVYTSSESKLSLSSGDTTDTGAGFQPQNRKYNVTTNLDELYAPITDSMSGETLRTNLRNITSVKTQYTYGDLRYNLLYTDEDPSNSGYLYSIYDGKDVLHDWDYGASWNREHVWPCAHMSGINEKERPGNSDKGPYTDMHNIRVSSPSANGNKADYFVGNQNQSNCYFVNVGEGDHRGDTARILLYMYTEYDQLVLSDSQNTNTNVTYGYLTTILEWNSEDPVDDFEKQRNNRIEEYQGNRNPFIDHPEYADRLFS